MANVKVRQFAGDVRLYQIETDGTYTPVIPEAADADGNQPIETDAMTFTYEAGDTTTITSKRRDSRYGQAIYSSTQPGQTSISLTLLEMPIPILARVLYGDAASADVAEGSVSDATLVVSAKNIPIALPHRYIKSSPAPVVNDGATVLTAGTDYVIDYRRGTILVKAAGVDVGDSLTLDYSYEEVTGTTILGGAVPEQDFLITGDLEDRNSGEQGLLEVWQARLTVDGDIDWLSAEPVQPTLTGLLITPVGKPSPYVFRSYEQAA